MPKPFSLTHFNSLTADSIVATEWLALLSERLHTRFYHHPDWYLAIDEHLLPGKIELCSIRSERATVAIIPGVYNAQRHRLATPVHDHLSLGDVILRPGLDPDAIEQVCDALLSDSSHSLWDWQIGNLPAHTPLARAVTDLEKTHTQVRKARESAWFDLSDTLPPGGKLRRNLNRLRSKLGNEGEVTLQWVTDQTELPAAYEHFLALESSGWKGQNGQSTAIAHDPALAGFYRRLLQPVFPGLKPMITLLWLDQRCIAAQFGLQTGDCISLLKIAYEEEFSSYSPGSLLLQDVMAEAALRCVKTLSLVTSPQWASRWHPDIEPVWHMTRYADSSGGLALKTLDRLKQTARTRLRPAA